MFKNLPKKESFKIERMIGRLGVSIETDSLLTAEEKRDIELEAIKSGNKRFMSSWRNITFADLLSVDENNISYLEYAFKNNVYFSGEVAKDLFSNLEVLYFCAKNGFFGQVDVVPDEDIYFEKNQDGKSLIEYIFEHDVRTSFFFFGQFEKHIELVDYLVKYDRFSLSRLSPELVGLLLEEQNGVYPIDKYIHDPNVINEVLRKASKDKIISYCTTKNDYTILKDAGEELLLYDMDGEKKVIEFLLDSGNDPTFSGFHFKSSDILELLVERNRFDLLYGADLSLLLSWYDGERTFLDLMIEKQKQGIDVHLERLPFRYWINPAEMTAMELIKLAQNDFQMFVPSITSGMLLHKGFDDKKTVLEQMLDIDRELTISKILPRCRDRSEPTFALILRNLGIEESTISISTDDARFSDGYIEDFNKKYASGCVSVCPELLDELRDLLYSDGLSDRDAIDALLISYTYLTSEDHPNNEMFVHELKQLIEIKKANPDKFTYTKIDHGAYFEQGGGVHLCNDIISTINHETSHALHYYLADDYVPENYFEVTERIRNSEGILDRVKEYSERMSQLKKELKDAVSKSNIEEYYESLYQGQKLLDLSLFLAKSKEEQKAELIADYNEQVLDVILADTYSVEEFIKQRIEIEVNEIVDNTFRNDYDAFIAIGDIIDAVFKGKFGNGALFDEDGVVIEPAYGHGICYYDGPYHGFDEMIANYGSIVKSKNSEQILSYLRSIVGDELVDMIKDVYENNILKLQTYAQGAEEEAIGHAR